MALSLVHANPPPDAYLGGLRALTAALSPVLLDRDRWGFLTLRDVFGIDETSKLYCGALPESILQSIQAEGRNLLERGDDGFLWGMATISAPFRNRTRPNSRPSSPGGSPAPWRVPGKRITGASG